MEPVARSDAETAAPTEGGATGGANRRASPRVVLEGQVEVTFENPVVGDGSNVSAQGVLFECDQPLKVAVRLPGRDEPVEGELVRVQDLGNGRQGVAVRFPDPIEQPVGPEV